MNYLGIDRCPCAYRLIDWRIRQMRLAQRGANTEGEVLRFVGDKVKSLELHT